jgi:hypothetical protein
MSRLANPITANPAIKCAFVSVDREPHLFGEKRILAPMMKDRWPFLSCANHQDQPIYDLCPSLAFSIPPYGSIPLQIILKLH